MATYRCRDCAAKEAVIAELQRIIRELTSQRVVSSQPSHASSPTFYDTCSCNPKNGGNGICGCVLGGQTVCRS